MLSASDRLSASNLVRPMIHPGCARLEHPSPQDRHSSTRVSKVTALTERQHVRETAAQRQTPARSSSDRRDARVWASSRRFRFNCDTWPGAPIIAVSTPV